MVGEVRKYSASEAVVELEPLDGSKTTGNFTLVPGDRGGSEVRLSLRGLPDPQGIYVGAVYRGSCPNQTGNQGSLQGNRAGYRFAHGNHGQPEIEEGVVQPLTSVASNPEGRGSSVTPLPTPPEELLSGAPKYVDVHGEGGTALACADLLPARSSSA
ncbi:MAG: hypothetical protein AVDCRST_MAG01-01-3545 [uncultured Rubrobacteraceae bacterium]|uniref:Superoxide dismutase copper/zinc binding domain-containing protein n=1 Tax=uncultured Rubrobacteraceae bacterium TaxID=349277 RepID=A0A6J4QCG1_9ACTN|nr:MAG: hypothetical protein AVDCRST_MAG01-01-3545 [uncultured Rubrobacteraceae bacterium]